MTNELTDVRCSCGDEYPADSYDAGFIAGSGMCQNCDAALPPKDICTCPSGNGSLRHPCPAHPASVEQAGGDERDLQGAQGERQAFEAHESRERRLSPADQKFWFRRGAVADYDIKSIDDAWKAWKARAALAQPALQCKKCGGTGDADSGGIHPWGEAAMVPCDCAHTERAQGKRTEDGDTIIDRLRLGGLTIDGDNAYKRDLLDCVVGALAFGFQGRPAPEETHWLHRFWEIGNAEREARAALAQPSGEVVVTKNESGAIVSVTRQDKEGRVLSVIAESATLTAQAEKAEVVARVVHSNPVVLGQCGPLNANDELMTVAQHAASVARWAEMFNRVEQQRDAALAEVEHLRQFERICEGLPQDAIDGGWTVQGIRGYAKRLEDQLKAALARVADMKTMADNYCALLMDANAKLAEMERQEPVALANRGLHAFWVKWTEAAAGLYGPGIKLYAAPVAQAQHSVPVAREQLERLVRILDAHNYAKDAEALMALLAAAPGKEVPQAWLDVQAERRRQVEAEGWTPEHDDLYCAAELPRAAAAYILNGANDEAPAIWPFSAKWWKPRDARSNYVRASALILAEIERLDRAAPGKEGL
ncbi:hypothetical protein ACM7W4_28065 [Pseudomonas aeruginosa]